MNPLTQSLMMGAQAFGFRWLGLLGGTSSEVGEAIAIDSNNDIYLIGNTASQGAGSFDILIAKYASSGVIQWQRSLGGASDETGYGIAIDSNNDIYLIGHTASQGAGSLDILIAKYASSGVIQWQRSLGGASNESGYGIAIDSNNNIYINGNTLSQGAGAFELLIAKYNSSGVIQWQRSLGGASSDSSNGIAIDSNNDIYLIGNTASQGAGSSDALIAKYNSSGVIQWQRSLGGASDETGYGIAIDSNNNIYVIGNTLSQGAGSFDIFIAKYNSSGVIQWQRVLGGTLTEAGYGIAVDSNNDIYITGNVGISGANTDILIAKYNSSGVIQWQRSLGCSTSDGGNAIAIDSNNNICVIGNTNVNGNQDLIICRLFADGSGTGTFGSFTYAATTLTDAAGTLTDASRTLTDAARTLTDASRTLTDAASTLPSTLTLMQ